MIKINWWSEEKKEQGREGNSCKDQGQGFVRRNIDLTTKNDASATNKDNCNRTSPNAIRSRKCLATECPS
ncbi:hypothetical protein VNO78_14794 [Psophocarpus tetragonolobus]|uniref:Uncharacterized protein n=1 Tax=Psophocarpus tetragonolobus TaxID=3891 RepID=A0AAN9XIL3_PSOTE